MLKTRRQWFNILHNFWPKFSKLTSLRNSKVGREVQKFISMFDIYYNKVGNFLRPHELIHNTETHTFMKNWKTPVILFTSCKKIIIKYSRENKHISFVKKLPPRLDVTKRASLSTNHIAGFIEHSSLLYIPTFFSLRNEDHFYILLL